MTTLRKHSTWQAKGKTAAVRRPWPAVGCGGHRRNWHARIGVALPRDVDTRTGQM